MGNVLYRFRWLIGLLVIVLAVIFQISGSSIGMWAEYLPECTDDGLLAGTPRSIRADEWAVSTVASFAQTYEGEFEYFGDALRGEETDMVLASNAPVLSPVAVTRIFSMGYVLFGIGGGLAFFWVARLVILFLVTFQFFLLVTGGKKGWSLAGALLVTFSGAVQWWFHTSALLECIVYGQLAVLAVRKYFHTEKKWQRVLLAVCLGLLGYAYAMALYPAWQVPLVYVFAAVLIWQLTELKREGVLRLKLADGGCILLAAAVCAAGLLYFFSMSAEGLAAVSATEYPGARFITGGGLGAEFFQYANSIFYPLTQEGMAGNVCEQAVFFDLFPLGILLALWQLLKKKRKDVLLYGLLAVSLFFFLFCAVGFPRLLAGLTFMSNCPVMRVLVIFGYANIVILIRCLACMEPAGGGGKNRQKKSRLPVLAAAVCGGLAAAFLAHQAQADYMTRWMAAAAAVLLAALIYAALRGRERYFALLCAVTAVFTGVLVNPVQKGADFIYENPLVQAIGEINEEEEGRWLVEGLVYPMNNIPLFVGASTINSTSYYPDLERWRQLDPDGDQEYLYNRFAHVQVYLTDAGASWFEEGIAGDRLNVWLDVGDLEKMGADYILTGNQLEQYDREGQRFQLLEQVGAFRIYRVGSG